MGLKRQHILQDVQVLILDGLSVTSELISEIILDDSFNVRLLSIREVQNLNERKLMQALEYSVRPTRPDGMPRLQGLYIFGKKDVPSPFKPQRLAAPNKQTARIGHARVPDGVTSVQGAQIGAQLNQRSRDALSFSLGAHTYDMDEGLPVVFAKPPMRGWAETMLACKGLVSFDAVLCTGPRHTLKSKEPGTGQLHWYEEHSLHLPAAVAKTGLLGCCSCGLAPEYAARPVNTSSDDVGLLISPPLHSSSLRAARKPLVSGSEGTTCLVARCEDCLRGRYCESCHKWWCEDCYRTLSDQNVRPPPGLGSTAGLPGLKDVAGSEHLKVYMGLCVEDCLVGEMMSGAGSNGMWG
jgi:hypothetical protein